MNAKFFLDNSWMPPNLLRAIVARISVLVVSVRRIWLQCANANIRVGRGVAIGKDVEVRSTDGADLQIEARVHISHGVSLVAQAGRLYIGTNTFVGPWTTIVARDSICIGGDCLIAERVTIRDQDHQIHGPNETSISQAGFVCAPIVIGDGAWIGAGAVILKGVTVGKGAVVAANAVVNRDVAEFEIVGGIPAKRIGVRGTWGA